MKQVDWSKVTIHCSSLSAIMADRRERSPRQLWEDACFDIAKKEEQLAKLKKRDGPRAASLETAIRELKILIPILESRREEVDPLSEGCKTLLSGVYAMEKYGKWSPNKDIGSKHTVKGDECEPEALLLVSRLDKLLLEKNEIRVENPWFSGLPDAFEGESPSNATVIHDVKCPWDIETFFSYLNKKLPDIYWWQMQGYMSLSGASRAEVHFCLINNPEHQIKAASESILRNMDVISDESPAYLAALEELMNNMKFDDMPLTDRRIKFIVERDDEAIDRAKKRVEDCRKYLVEFEKLHFHGPNYLSLMQNESKHITEEVQSDN